MGCGRYRQRGCFIQGWYIQWALYCLTVWVPFRTILKFVSLTQGFEGNVWSVVAEGKCISYESHYNQFNSYWVFKVHLSTDSSIFDFYFETINYLASHPQSAHLKLLLSLDQSVTQCS